MTDTAITLPAKPAIHHEMAGGLASDIGQFISALCNGEITPENGLMLFLGIAIPALGTLSWTISKLIIRIVRATRHFKTQRYYKDSLGTFYVYRLYGQNDNTHIETIKLTISLPLHKTRPVIRWEPTRLSATVRYGYMTRSCGNVSLCFPETKFGPELHTPFMYCFTIDVTNRDLTFAYVCGTAYSGIPYMGPVMISRHQLGENIVSNALDNAFLSSYLRLDTYQGIRNKLNENISQTDSTSE